MIQSAATRMNQSLLNVIQTLPPPSDFVGRQSGDKTTSSTPSMIPGSPTPTPNSLLPPRQGSSKDTLPDTPPDPSQQERTSATQTPKHRPSLMLDGGGRSSTLTQVPQVSVDQPTQTSRPDSPASTSAISVPHVQQSPEASMLQEKDSLDYGATVEALTIQFASEHEETRVAALKWLIMLHQKAPKKVNPQGLALFVRR